MKSLSVLAAAVAIGRVRGHGGVYNYTIGGVDYPGHYPWLPEEGQVSIQRRWWPDPIYRVDHPYLACNRGNPLATTLPKLHAPVRAGSNVTVSYVAPPCPLDPPVPFPTKPSVPEYGDNDPAMRCSGPSYPWPHHSGPLMVYMADCGGPCDEWDGSGKRWFKIWEAGHRSDGWEGGDTNVSIADSWGWGQSYVIREPWTVAVPSSLKPGNYLIRHEAVNLDANLQFYPECAQLEVTGDGAAVPSAEYLAEFPGAYKEDDEAWKFAGNLYGPDGHNTFVYPMPGPKVWNPEEE